MKNRSGQVLTGLLIFIVIIASVLFVGGFESRGTSNATPDSSLIPVEPSANPQEQDLQLHTFGFTTVAPTQPPVSSPVPKVDCEKFVGVQNPPASPLQAPDQSSPPSSCGIAGALMTGQDANGQCCVEDGAANSEADCCGGVQNFPYLACTNHVPVWCDAKPVIYLYPEKPTEVSVKVIIPGKVTVSIPEYENGWKVLAYPDGTLFSGGEKYRELFYETAQEKSSPPSTGVFVGKDRLKQELIDITSALGLNKTEQNEFLTYWLSRLNNINKPYILVSYFNPEQKEEVDHVEISPKPDTFINFIMYFKGVDKPFEIKPLTLPSNPPVRSGFTAVEWGGILDNN